MADMIRDFWAIIAAFIGSVIWLIRLEAIALANKADLRRVWSQRQEDMAAHREARDESNKMLSEIRADIKSLLREAKQ